MVISTGYEPLVASTYHSQDLTLQSLSMTTSSESQIDTKLGGYQKTDSEEKNSTPSWHVSQSEGVQSSRPLYPPT